VGGKAASTGRGCKANRFHDTFQVRYYILIAEAHDAKAFSNEERIALLVSLSLRIEIMRLTVKFDEQPHRHADEIGNVIPQRHLSAKSEPIDPIGFQIAPQQRLGRRHRPAQLLCAAPLKRADRNMRHRRLPPSLTLPHKGGGNRKIVSGERIVLNVRMSQGRKAGIIREI
jgi:hypothetical protein